MQAFPPPATQTVQSEDKATQAAPALLHLQQIVAAHDTPESDAQRQTVSAIRQASHDIIGFRRQKISQSQLHDLPHEEIV